MEAALSVSLPLRAPKLVLHILHQLTSTRFSLALHRPLLQNSQGLSQLINKSLLIPALSSSGLHRRAVAETRLVWEESKRCEKERGRTEKNVTRHRYKIMCPCLHMAIAKFQRYLFDKLTRMKSLTLYCWHSQKHVLWTLRRICSKSWHRWICLHMFNTTDFTSCILKEWQKLYRWKTGTCCA